MSIRPALIEEVERTNAVMVCPQQKVGFAQQNPYAMNVYRRKNWNCYNCGRFGYLARNYKIGEQETELGMEEDWNTDRII